MSFIPWMRDPRRLGETFWWYLNNVQSADLFVSEVILRASMWTYKFLSGMVLLVAEVKHFQLLGLMLFFLPSATVVAERLCFHKHLSFCPGGGVHHHTGQTPPPADTPLGRHPPGRHSLGQTLSPRQTSPWTDTPLQDGHCSGWYTSYWNAFVFNLVVFYT